MSDAAAKFGRTPPDAPACPKSARVADTGSHAIDAHGLGPARRKPDMPADIVYPAPQPSARETPQLASVIRDLWVRLGPQTTEEERDNLLKACADWVAHTGDATLAHHIIALTANRSENAGPAAEAWVRKLGLEAMAHSRRLAADGNNNPRAEDWMAVSSLLMAVAALSGHGRAREAILGALLAQPRPDRAARITLDWVKLCSGQPASREDGMTGAVETWLGAAADEKQSPCPDTARNGAVVPETLLVAPALSRHGRKRGRPGDTGQPLPGDLARFSALGDPLPLLGGLRNEPNGQIALVARLQAEFPWADDILELIERRLRLSMHMGRTSLSLPPLLLLGPPGTGKTRFAMRLAEIAGCGFGLVCAGGSGDNRLLAGTARGWSTASPCLPAHVMLQTCSANPVIFVDEIDKTATDTRTGRVVDTLLSMIEPSSAKSWPDEGLVTGLDLSRINWIFAANEAGGLSAALLSRVVKVTMPQPGPAHFDALIASISADVASEHGGEVEKLPRLDAREMAWLRESFAVHRSPRRLRLHLLDALAASLARTTSPRASSVTTGPAPMGHKTAH